MHAGLSVRFVSCTLSAVREFVSNLCIQCKGDFTLNDSSENSSCRHKGSLRSGDDSSH